MQAHWNTLINPYGASFPPLRRGWWAVCLKCFVASLKGSDTTVAPAEIARELKRCVNQSFASIEDGCLGREKERGEGERGGVKKDERLISFADGRFKKLLHFLCIDWKLFTRYDMRIEYSENEKLNVSLFCFNLSNVNLNFSNWYYVKLCLRSRELDLDFSSISNISNKMKILKI